jgi:predicted RNA-binding Zn ribbon-like protein
MRLVAISFSLALRRGWSVAKQLPRRLDQKLRPDRNRSWLYAGDMDVGPATLPAGLDLVKDFVNTLDAEAGSDAFATPPSAVRWLSSRGLMSADEDLTEADLARITEARESLRDLLVANAGGELDRAAIAALDRSGRSAGLVARFGLHGRARLAPSGGGVEAVLGSVLAVVYTAQATGVWSRLKACGEKGCRWAFYDSSKNRSRTWCSMASCGNRAKSRTYRRRRA